jgi:hypothetical protein
MITVRFLAVLTAALLSLSCNPEEPFAEAPDESASIEAPISSNNFESGSLGGPEIVLVGTDVFEFASFTVRPLDLSATGQYGVEQGGAELTLNLSPVGGRSWRVERTHQEPGEPQDRVVYNVELREGMMLSSDGNVVVLGTSDGVLVLERTSGTIPANYWVHYLRRE